MSMRQPPLSKEYRNRAVRAAFRSYEWLSLVQKKVGSGTANSYCHYMASQTDTMKVVDVFVCNESTVQLYSNQTSRKEMVFSKTLYKNAGTRNMLRTAVLGAFLMLPI